MSTILLVLVIALLAIWFAGFIWTVQFLKSGSSSDMVGVWSWQSWFLAAAWPLLLMAWFFLPLFSSFLSHFRK